MKVTSTQFLSRSNEALEDKALQQGLRHIHEGFVEARARAFAEAGGLEAKRDRARDIRDRALANLGHYLEVFEARVTEAGGTVHWAHDDIEAREIIAAICHRVGAHTVTKSKSMVTEEIELNPYLEDQGFSIVETDLGEYIIQLRHEKPSHIVAPVIHLTKTQVADTFHEKHRALGYHERLEDRAKLVAQARAVLRQAFMTADVGITGANFLVAETGMVVIVTNEGNADLVTTVPHTHIAVTGIEKVVPTLEDTHHLLRMLTRSATGQATTSYISFLGGPREANETAGPENFHVVLVDNGRSGMIGGEFQDMLRCIRCGACLNHCPVYANIGGHAYGSVYPGPMGAVLTPQLAGLDQAGLLPNASTFCGKCEEVCPVRIPLPKLMRHWREREFRQHLSPASIRTGLRFWSWLAGRPALYGYALRLGGAALRLASRKGWLRRLPLWGSGWTLARDMAAPAPQPFQHQWRQRERES